MAHYPGYTVLRTEDCPEQHGTLTLLTHDVSGAAVLLVENEDVNKAFGIGFGTFPSDDTGVFHILEHSVLAGSEKYPVKSPFLQLLKSSMASFLNAMTFPDKTVYPFATPNETDFRNLMDVYLNAVFCPLAMVDKGVFEQEGWHRDADGTVSGVVYNEMQGALASPDAQLQDALERAMFPDTAYGFVSGGDPASIPALTYEKYKRVYRRHYSADNCCITLYGKMDMADKLARLDKDYLSKMPKAAARPRLTMQDEQPGAFVELPYYTDQPKPDEVQCALAWYTGAFADRERQLGVEILLGALLSTNSSPLKAALLAEQLGADIDIGFDDSTLQPTLELLLRGATVDSARKFAPAVRKAVDELQLMTMLNGEYDHSNAILTFHAGTGGTEAQDWAEMLYRMYNKWASNHGMTVEVLDYQDGDEAGMKSASMMVKGANAYGLLKSENGVHRLVRVSPFDANARRQTSFASLEVMPELDNTIQVDIRPSGAGGQHINKTSSAVRLIHKPTGIVVSCQTQRSQFQNRDYAMEMLKAKLYQIAKQQHMDKIDDIKGVQNEIAWGHQIRSYVFMPYTMVKDHRTNYETGNVDAVMDGDLDGFIFAYLKAASRGELQDT